MKPSKDRLEEDIIYFRKKITASECPNDKAIFETQLKMMEDALATFTEHQKIKEKNDGYSGR